MWLTRCPGGAQLTWDLALVRGVTAAESSAAGPVTYGRAFAATPCAGALCALRVVARVDCF